MDHEPRGVSDLPGSRALPGLVAATFSLIVLGALVRAHGAGLACPDWPLCFGKLVPAFDLRVAFEYTHRALAGGLTLAFLWIGARILRHPRAREAAGGAVLTAAVLLAIQILLGALTVWHLLAAWTVTAHLLTGNLFAATLLVAWLRLRRARDAREALQPAPSAPVPPLLVLASVLLLVQLVLGGLVASRFAGLACPEWPTCIGGVWFPSLRGALGLHILHRLNAYLLAALLLLAPRVLRHRSDLRPLLRLAAGLAVVQVGVGVANVWTQLRVEITGAHSALAAALVLTLAAALDTARGHRATAPDRSPAEGEPRHGPARAAANRSAA